MELSPRDKFEQRLKILDSSTDKPAHIKDSLVFVHDTLETSMLICKSVFGEEMSDPEVVLAVYDLVSARHSQLTKSNE